MNSIKNELTHYFQPTTSSCGYAALAELLSHYNSNVLPKDLIRTIPQPTDENGEPTGSITAQLATWCQQHGYNVDFYSFDFQITDFSWIGLESKALHKKLNGIKGNREVPTLGGKYWSERYIQAYIELLEAGGKLTIMPHVTTELLYKLLQKAPVYVNVASSVTQSRGRSKCSIAEDGKPTKTPDEKNGIVGTHSIIIYGNDEMGNFLVADPWDGLQVINPETMICAISAAEIECDSQCFQIVQRYSPPKTK